MKSSIPITYLLNSPVSSLQFEEQMFLIMRWARARESRSVFLANVHMLMEAYWNKDFAAVLKSGDLVSSDGMPLVWMLRRLGIHNQDRVAGMDVFLRLCELAQQSQVKIFFLGSQTEVLKRIKTKLEQQFPKLQIAGMESLPFRPLTQTEDQNVIKLINQSGTGLLFVCLGCPKQELWIAQHKHKIKATMIGLGAVFPLYAGLYKRAPLWIREWGLEWLYRFLQEPHRLWKRYSKTIPPFLYLAFQQILKEFLCLNNKQLSIINRQININNITEYYPDNYEPLPIGKILVNQNLISENILTTALEKQKYSSKKLGEILVEEGLITESELKYYLRNQNILLGNILVDKKIVSPSLLRKKLLEAKKRQKKLGEFLIENKIISEKELLEALFEQYLRKQGKWLNFRID